MDKENRERLENLRAINVQLQEENNHLKKQVQMYDHMMEKMKN
jgi:hypothetical protein